jgi:archaemetzincin
MRRIQLIALGTVPESWMGRLAQSLQPSLEVGCDFQCPPTDLSGAFNRERGQYSSAQLLAGIASRKQSNGCRVLAITCVDLYIPVLTFVFGEAQVKGAAAIVSTCRLRQEFYGLPPDDELLCQRLLKEALHELGHMFGLIHCSDLQCAMAASHAVEWIDLKNSRYCDKCSSLAVEQAPALCSEHSALTGREGAGR